VADLPRLLRGDACALLELGPDQADPVAEEAARGGLLEVDRVVDAGGVERVLVLQKPPTAG